MPSETTLARWERALYAAGLSPEEIAAIFSRDFTEVDGVACFEPAPLVAAE